MMERFKNISMFPIFVIIAFIPLIKIIAYVPTYLEQYPWFDGSTERSDVSLVVKMYAFYLMSALMLILMLTFILKAHRGARHGNVTLITGIKSKVSSYRIWLVAALAFEIFAIISTIISPYRRVGLSLTGGFTQQQSLWVILCYGLLFAYTLMVIDSDERIRLIETALGIVTLVLNCLGVTELTGHSFFMTKLGNFLLYFPGSLFGNVGTVDSTFERGRVSLTLYNPNYVGMYGALVLPICLAIAIGAKETERKIYWTMMAVGTLVVTLGSKSKSFLLAELVVLIVGIIYLRKAIVRRKAIYLTAALVLVAAGAIYFNHEGMNPLTMVKNALAAKPLEQKLTDLDFSENGVTLTYAGNKAVINYSFDDNGVNSFAVTDENKRSLSTHMDDNENYIIDTDELGELYFTPVSVDTESGHKYWYIRMELPAGAGLNFGVKENGYSYITNFLNFDTIVNAPYIKGINPMMFTSRGFIWARTIPLLKGHIFHGYGADSFTEVYPQNDYLAKAYSGIGITIITKPHCLYLQIASNFGVTAALIIAAMLIIYIIKSISLYVKADLQDEYTIFGAGISLGVTGYAITAITNDSCLALTPFVIAIFAIGIAINKRVKN